MKEKRIIVVIDKAGNPNIEVEGVGDASCLKETEQLEKAYGGEVLNRKKKVEAAIPVKSGTGIKIGH
jgi:hypothetical protein